MLAAAWRCGCRPAQAGARPSPGRPCAAAAASSRDRLVVGLGGEQADEADLAARLAVGAVAAHADVVHVGAPVHPRAAGWTWPRSAARRLPSSRRSCGRQHRRLAAAAQHQRGSGRAARPGRPRARTPAPRPHSRRRRCADSRRRGRPGRRSGRRPSSAGRRGPRPGAAGSPAGAAAFSSRDGVRHQGRHGREVGDRQAHVGQRGAQARSSSAGAALLGPPARARPGSSSAGRRRGLDHRVEHGHARSAPASTSSPMTLSTRNGASGWTISSRSRPRSPRRLAAGARIKPDRPARRPLRRPRRRARRPASDRRRGLSASDAGQFVGSR